MKKKGPGRPNEGKTDTIRKRAVTVYLPNEELVVEWKSTAKKSGISVSQFVLEAVERQRSHGYGDSPLPKLELEKRYKKALNKNEKLQEKCDLLDSAFSAREQDILSLKEQLEKRGYPFDIGLATDMIEVFKNWPDSVIHGIDMVEVLGISDGNLEKSQEVRRTADFLETLGLMKSAGLLKWKWLGERTPRDPFTSKWTGKKYGSIIELSE
jgi:hypothetical protein